MSPFEDATYYLGDDEYYKKWSRATLYSFDQPVYFCGDVIVEFFIDNFGQTPLDSEIMIQENYSYTTNYFTVLESYDSSKTGVYPIKYKVYFEEYPHNFAVSAEKFTIIIKDPCDRPEDI